jgi:hypothetical protein
MLQIMQVGMFLEVPQLPSGELYSNSACCVACWLAQYLLLAFALRSLCKSIKSLHHTLGEF